MLPTLTNSANILIKKEKERQTRSGTSNGESSPSPKPERRTSTTSRLLQSFKSLVGKKPKDQSDDELTIPDECEGTASTSTTISEVENQRLTPPDLREKELIALFYNLIALTIQKTLDKKNTLFTILVITEITDKIIQTEIEKCFSRKLAEGDIAATFSKPKIYFSSLSDNHLSVRLSYQGILLKAKNQSQATINNSLEIKAQLTIKESSMNESSAEENSTEKISIEATIIFAMLKGEIENFIGESSQFNKYIDDQHDDLGIIISSKLTCSAVYAFDEDVKPDRVVREFLDNSTLKTTFLFSDDQTLSDALLNTYSRITSGLMLYPTLFDLANYVTQPPAAAQLDGAWSTCRIENGDQASAVKKEITKHYQAHMNSVQPVEETTRNSFR